MECINCHEKIGSERMLHGFFICTENHMQCRQCANKMHNQCPLCGDMELNEYIFNIKPLKIDKNVSKVSIEMLRKPPDQTRFLHDSVQESISAEVSFISELNKNQDSSLSEKPSSHTPKLTSNSTTTISRAETVFITDDGKIVKEDLEIKRSTPSCANLSFLNNGHQLGSLVREQGGLVAVNTHARNADNQTNAAKYDGGVWKLEEINESFADKESVQYASYTFSQPHIQQEWFKQDPFIEEIPQDRSNNPLSLNPFYEEIRIIEEQMAQDALSPSEQFPWQRIEEFIKQQISQFVHEFFNSDSFRQIFNRNDINQNKIIPQDEDDGEDERRSKLSCCKAVSTFSEPRLQLLQVHVPHIHAKYAHLMTATHVPAPNNSELFKAKAPYVDQQMKLLKAYRECPIPLDVDKPDLEHHCWRGHIPTAPEPETETVMFKEKTIIRNMESNELVERKKSQGKEHTAQKEVLPVKKIYKRKDATLVRTLEKHKEKSDKREKYGAEAVEIHKSSKRHFINLPQQDEMCVVIKKDDQIAHGVLSKPESIINDSTQTLRTRLKTKLELDRAKFKMEEKLKKDTIKAKLQNILTSTPQQQIEKVLDETQNSKDKNLLGKKPLLGEIDLLTKQASNIIWETRKLPTMFRVLYNPKGALHCPIHVVTSCSCDFKGFGYAPMCQPTISLANTKYYKFETPPILKFRHSNCTHDPIYCPDAFCRRSFLPTDCTKHYILAHHNQPLFDIRIGQRLNFKLNPCPSQSNYACSQLLILIGDKIREFGRTQYQNSMPLLVMTAKLKLTYLMGYQLRENSRMIGSDEDYLLIWILGVPTPELKSTTYTFTTWRYRKEKPLCHISQTLNVLDITERQIPINIYNNAGGILLTPQELYLLTNSHKDFIQCQVEVH